MPYRHLNTPEDVADFSAFLGAMKLPVTVEWRKGRDRSKEQNAVQWLWAAEAGEQTFETPEDVQARWKLVHGVPILRADSGEFRDDYDAMLRPLRYEMKLRLMKQFFPVSSVMNVRQMVRYLDAIFAECAANGIRLTPPDAELSRYQARYRTEKEEA